MHTGKQTSRTEFFQAGGHHILMVKYGSGVKLSVIDEDGNGCNGKAKYFPRSELESLITQARDKGETEISLTIPSRCVSKGRVKTSEETITFQCRFLLLHLRRLQ